MNKKLTIQTLAQELALFQVSTLKKFSDLNTDLFEFADRIKDLETDNLTLTDMVGKLDYRVEELEDARKADIEFETKRIKKLKEDLICTECGLKGSHAISCPTIATKPPLNLFERLKKFIK